MKRKTRIFLLFLFAFFLFVPSQSYAKAKLNKSKKTLVITESFQLKVKGTSKKASWSSSNKSVVSVTTKGKIKAKGVGNAVVTASVGGKKISCKVIVVKPNLPTDFKVYKSDTRKISISNQRSFSKITYASTNKKIATVTSKGSVKGIANGSCYIKMTFNKVYTTKIKVTVSNAITYSTVNTMKGATIQLIPPTYKNVAGGTYTSSNANIGYVNGSYYHAVNYGTTTITYKNGVYQHRFTVKNYCWEAHRGYTAVEPENTLEAIRAAKLAGANSVEIDIRATEDGDFVLMHDATLDRTTCLSKSVKYKTVEQLSQPIVLKNGIPTYKVPTLQEALVLCGELGLNVAIEMKDLPTVNYAYSKEYLVTRLVYLVKTYGNSNTSILFTKPQQVKDFMAYSDGSIECRVTNDSYTQYEELRTLVAANTFLMTTTQYALKHYNGLIKTQNNPIQ